MMQNPRTTKRERGKAGEEYACRLLAKNGYGILCRNYTCPGGEIDIIAAKENYICFVEVKLRSLQTGENAAEAVDTSKLSRIKTASEHFLSEYHDNKYVSSLTPRFDIIELYTCKSIVKKHNHITGVQ